MKKYLLALLIIAISACSGISQADEMATAQTQQEATAQADATEQAFADAQVECLDEIKDHFLEWDDAGKLANTTGRGNLDSPVSELQRIRRDLVGIECGGSAQGVRDLYIDYMEAQIEGFLSFMSNDADAVVDTNFSIASALLELASYELAHVEVNGELDMSAVVMLAISRGQPSDIRVEVIDETGSRTGEYVSFPTPALVSNVEKISSYMRFNDADSNRYEGPMKPSVYFFVASDLLE